MPKQLQIDPGQTYAADQEFPRHAEGDRLEAAVDEVDSKIR